MENIILAVILLILNLIGVGCVEMLCQGCSYKTPECYYKIIFAGAIGSIMTSIIEDELSVSSVISIGMLCALICEFLLLLRMIVKYIYKNDEMFSFYNDGTPPKFYITGDKHRNFDLVKRFCKAIKTNRRDVLIVLGDAGFNYFGDERDDKLKKDVSKLPLTLLCIHGNKENRPQHLSTYGMKNFCGGKVFYEPQYPNIYFAIDGEIYDLDGKKYIVIGGAHSVDKTRCLENGLPYFDDEMPDDSIKETVEAKLQNNKVYGILSHTCPEKYIPKEMFVSTRLSQSSKCKNKKGSKKFVKIDVDRSTEAWLDSIESKTEYTVWYCGHYHVDKEIDKISMMHKCIKPLHYWEEE